LTERFVKRPMVFPVDVSPFYAAFIDFCRHAVM